jgi:hypothetical protein
MKKARWKLCGLPESASLRRVGAAQELRRIALECPDQVAEDLVRAAKEEHRQATQPDRDLIRRVKDRGGLCFPGGMTHEEWRNRLPRTLHGKSGRCVPTDELAQELADRGTISEPSSDGVIDHLRTSYERARSEAPAPDPGELRREARRIVRQRVGHAVRELIREARRENA